MFVKHPLTYIDATANNTFEYWYPFYHYGGKPIFWTDITSHEPLGERFEDLRHLQSANIVNSAINYLDSWRSLPLIGLLLAPGSYAWLIIFAIGYLVKSCSSRAWLLLSFAILILILIASPVNGYFRYALPAIAAAPLIILLLLQPENSCLPFQNEGGTNRNDA